MSSLLECPNAPRRLGLFVDLEAIKYTASDDPLFQIDRLQKAPANVGSDGQIADGFERLRMSTGQASPQDVLGVCYNVGCSLHV